VTDKRTHGQTLQTDRQTDGNL